MKNYRFTPERREAFLALIRLGNRPIAAARAVGVHPKTAKNFARSHPEFAEEVELAHHEAAEPIEEVIYAAAKEGEPWAAKMWLEAWNPAQWGAKPKQVEVSGTITHELGEGSPEDDILEIQRRALQREDDLALGTGNDEDEDEIVDAEVIDEQGED